MKKQLELFQETEKATTDIVDNPIEVKIEDAEWCFQFFNNEPIVFAWSDTNAEAAPLTLQINPIEGEGLTFQQNGMVFRVFPRPISEETQLQRANENAGNDGAGTINK